MSAQLLEPAVDVPRLQRRPDRGREDQVAVLPRLPSREPFGRLAGPPAFERPSRHGWDGERPPGRPGLRVDQPQRTVDPLERPPDAQDPVVEVDVLPPQPEHLTTPETHRQP